MNNITNSPKEDNVSANDAALFEVDIVKLHKMAIETLERGNFDSLQEMALTCYVNGLIDLYKEDNSPKSELTETGEVADLLDEMWQKVCALVEDMQFRRMFILICKFIFVVDSWPDGNLVVVDAEKFAKNDVLHWGEDA